MWRRCCAVRVYLIGSYKRGAAKMMMRVRSCLWWGVIGMVLGVKTSGAFGPPERHQTGDVVYILSHNACPGNPTPSALECLSRAIANTSAAQDACAQWCSVQGPLSCNVAVCSPPSALATGCDPAVFTCVAFWGKAFADIRGEPFELPKLEAWVASKTPGTTCISNVTVTRG